MKKMICVFLCVIMLQALFGMSCMATGASPTIAVGTASAEPGEIAEVVIRLQNNPGIVSMTLKVTYDTTVFTLKDIQDGGILGAQSHKPEHSSPYTLAWVNDASTANFTDDGVIARLKFEVEESATLGEEYPVTVSYDADNYAIYNKDVECVDFDVVNGSIFIGKGDSQPAVTPITDFSYRLVHGGIHITGYHGNDTSLNIAETYILNGRERSVTGIDESAFEANETITKVILPSTIESIGDYAFYDCTALTEVTLWSQKATIGEKAFGYYYISRTQDGKVKGFTLTAYQGSTAEEYTVENKMSFIAQTKPPLGKGDIDADGEYSVRDLNALRHHLLGTQSLAGDQLEAADLDEDGSIDVFDLVCLKMILAAE